MVSVETALRAFCLGIFPETLMGGRLSGTELCALVLWLGSSKELGWRDVGTMG